MSLVYCECISDLSGVRWCAGSAVVCRRANGQCPSCVRPLDESGISKGNVQNLGEKDWVGESGNAIEGVTCKYCTNVFAARMACIWSVRSSGTRQGHVKKQF